MKNGERVRSEETTNQPPLPATEAEGFPAPAAGNHRHGLC